LIIQLHGNLISLSPNGRLPTKISPKPSPIAPTKLQKSPQTKNCSLLTVYWILVLVANAPSAAERGCEATAIDSTVPEIELARGAALRSQIRIIDTFDPSPIPPWAIRQDAAPALKEHIRQTLLTMHTQKAGHTMLAKRGVTRLAPVTDTDYYSIRHISQVRNHSLS
jgi:hypothetical protein